MVPRMHCINTLFTVTSVEVYMLINDDFVCSRSSAICVLYYIFFTGTIILLIWKLHVLYSKCIIGNTIVNSGILL